MSLEEALATYNEIIDRYEKIAFYDVSATSHAMKDLAVCLSYLTMHRIKYQKEWNAAVFNFEGTNAAGEKHANEKVPALYKLRRIHEAGKSILDTMRTQISLLKQEK